jgi:hypothetical protein
MFPYIQKISTGACISFVIICTLFTYYIISKNARKGEYLVSNDWSNIRNYKKSKSLDGVEVRVLPKGHILEGQKGLFATKAFSQYDVIGDYTGVIRKSKSTDSENRYLFKLVDDLVIDARDFGNELRFANSNINISDEPNVTSRISYIDGLPRVLYICTNDIEPGEELLIDYGDDYNEEFLY